MVTVAMSTAAFLSLVTRWSASAAAVLAAALVVLWNAAIYFDSSALTAGTVQAADKGLRGATMGLHGMCGYAGGFVGPLGIGLVLDWAGSADGLGLTFGHLALIIHDRPVFLATPRRKKRGANRGCQLRLARPPLPRKRVESGAVHRIDKRPRVAALSVGSHIEQAQMRGTGLPVKRGRITQRNNRAPRWPRAPAPPPREERAEPGRPETDVGGCNKAL